MENKEYEVLDPKYVTKLGISWNVGLGSLYTKSISKYKYKSKYIGEHFIEPTKNFKYHVHYRGSAYPGAIGYSRSRTKELLALRKDVKMPDFNTKVPFNEYVQETIDSLALISPFGWGEICGRDFEAFVFGDALIKPDMSHLETYPDCYIENETYIPLKWDFSDFNSVLDELKTEVGQDKAFKIAVNGQKLYKSYCLLDEKKVEFVNHIISQIEKTK